MNSDTGSKRAASEDAALITEGTSEMILMVSMIDNNNNLYNCI